MDELREELIDDVEIMDDDEERDELMELVDDVEEDDLEELSELLLLEDELREDIEDVLELPPPKMTARMQVRSARESTLRVVRLRTCALMQPRIPEPLPGVVLWAETSPVPAKASARTMVTPMMVDCAGFIGRSGESNSRCTATWRRMVKRIHDHFRYRAAVFS